MQESISRVGRALDGKALLRERLRDPLADEEFVFDEQDANSFSVRCIYACVYVHGSHPPVYSRLMRCARKRSNWQKL